MTQANVPRLHAIELSDIPDCCPCTSLGRVLTFGSTLIVIYEINQVNAADGMYWAAIRCDCFLAAQWGGPNDEAFHNHPLYSADPDGIRHYTMQEVIGSPWIRERAAIADAKRNADRLMTDQHHFIFAFKENCVECVAESCVSLGVFPSINDVLTHVSPLFLNG